MVDYAPGMRTIIRDEEWMVRKIEKNGFENTKEILIELLSVSDSFTDDMLSEIATKFVSSFEEAQE